MSREFLRIADCGDSGAACSQSPDIWPDLSVNLLLGGQSEVCYAVSALDHGLLQNQQLRSEGTG